MNICDDDDNSNTNVHRVCCHRALTTNSVFRPPTLCLALVSASNCVPRIAPGQLWLFICCWRSRSHFDICSYNIHTVFLVQPDFTKEKKKLYGFSHFCWFCCQIFTFSFASLCVVFFKPWLTLSRLKIEMPHLVFILQKVECWILPSVLLMSLIKPLISTPDRWQASVISDTDIKICSGCCMIGGKYSSPRWYAGCSGAEHKQAPQPGGTEVGNTCSGRQVYRALSLMCYRYGHLAWALSRRLWSHLLMSHNCLIPVTW